MTYQSGSVATMVIGYSRSPGSRDSRDFISSIILILTKLSGEGRHYEYDSSQILKNSSIGRMVTCPTCRRRASRLTQRYRFSFRSSANAFNDLRSLRPTFSLAFSSIAVWPPRVKSTSKPDCNFKRLQTGDDSADPIHLRKWIP
jgi:hypothetical protein